MQGRTGDMSEQWLREYVRLAFQIEKEFQKSAGGTWYVDSYYGPPEWKAAAEAESAMSAIDLVRAVASLADSLPAQGFKPLRTTHLAKNVLSMETVCRKLNGETFSLEDEVQRCYDVHPARIPETQFDEALVLTDEALPGDGSLSERLQAYRKRFEMPKEKSGLLVGIIESALAEARRRTTAMFTLPADEAVELAMVTDKHYTANNTYLGHHRSHIDWNTDLPPHMNEILDIACHEAYPGHHTEFTLKDQLLYRERGYVEECIALLISPQSVISEGIATSAFDMVFTLTEAEQWLAEHVYPQVGIEPGTVDLFKLRQAGEMLDGVGENAAFMLHEGRSDEEILRYIAKYVMTTEEESHKFLEFLKAPLVESYIFTYFYGRELMRPLLQGADRQAVFQRFLTEQLYPSELL
jgi:hypothetical protein